MGEKYAQPSGPKWAKTLGGELQEETRRREREATLARQRMERLAVTRADAQAALGTLPKKSLIGRAVLSVTPDLGDILGDERANWLIPLGDPQFLRFVAARFVQDKGLSPDELVRAYKDIAPAAAENRKATARFRTRLPQDGWPEIGLWFRSERNLELSTERSQVASIVGAELRGTHAAVSMATILGEPYVARDIFDTLRTIDSVQVTLGPLCVGEMVADRIPKLQG